MKTQLTECNDVSCMYEFDPPPLLYLEQLKVKVVGDLISRIQFTLTIVP
ncbi:hypothetical protein HQ550_01200 [bacterium]|nr:hypothetical protein [bacterium]